jgi:hypothetical protein
MPSVPVNIERAVTEAKRMTDAEVLAELKKHGITNLEELVHAGLGQIKGQTGPINEAGDLLVFRCFLVAHWT